MIPEISARDFLLQRNMSNLQYIFHLSGYIPSPTCPVDATAVPICDNAVGQRPMLDSNQTADPGFPITRRRGSANGYGNTKHSADGADPNEI